MLSRFGPPSKDHSRPESLPGLSNSPATSFRPYHQRSLTVRLAILFALLFSTAAIAQKKPPPGPERDARVDRALESLDFVYEIDDDGDYQLIFETVEGRSQTVWIHPMTDRLLDAEVREIFSIVNVYVGGVPGGLLPRLLEENAQFILGSWAIEETAILFVTKVRADASPAELEAALLATASTADELEAELTDEDEW